MKQLIVECGFLQKSKCIDFTENNFNIEQDLLQQILYKPFNLNEKQIDNSKIFLTQESKIIQNIKEINFDLKLQINLKLLGGKGGFGTLMKKQANRRTKITNWDNSRDLQGRRIRHQTIENKLVDYYKKKNEENRKIRKAMEGYQKMKATIKSGESDIKLKQEFKDKLDKIENSMASTIIQGLKSQNKFKVKTDQDTIEEIVQRQQQLNQEQQDSTDLNSKRKRSESLEKKQQKDGNEKIEKIVISEDKQKKANDNNQKQEQDKKEYERIDLTKITTKHQLELLDDEQIKYELNCLGIKAGGRNQERVQRLWDIKLDPTKLLHPKYIAKKK